MSFLWECMILSLKVGVGGICWGISVFIVIFIIAGISYLIVNR